MAFVSASADLALGTAHTTRKGLFSRAYDRMIEARMRKAQRTVNGYLLTLDDQTLAELGHDRAALLRAGPRVGTPL